MASADWSKAKGAGEAKAIMRHSEKEERLKHNHSNKDIDKTLTGDNFSMEGLSYKERCDKYDGMIRELARNSRMRKDTVTLVCIEIPISNEIPRDRQADFTRRAYDIVGDIVGEENLIDGDFHGDEQHMYIDPKTHEERLSMNHLHVFAVPGVDGRLCAKEFCARWKIVQLNNRLEEMAQNEFGVKFMTGEGTKSLDSVESLKLASEKARIAQLNENVHERHSRVWKRECEVEEREISISRKEKELDTRSSEALRRDLELKAREMSLNTRETSLNALECVLRAKDEELQAKEREIALKGKINARLDELEKYVLENPKKVKFASAVNEVKKRAQAISEREASQQTEMSGKLSY